MIYNKLHRFGIADGEVTYQRRFIQTEVYKRNMAAQRIVFNEFGTSATPDPCQTIFHRWTGAREKERSRHNFAWNINFSPISAKKITYLTCRLREIIYWPRSTLDGALDSLFFLLFFSFPFLNYFSEWPRCSIRTKRYRTIPWFRCTRSVMNTTRLRKRRWCTGSIRRI